MSRLIDTTTDPTTDPTRTYGVVFSSASHDTTADGSLIAAYAPTLGAAVDEAARIRRNQPGTATWIVALRPADHRTHPGQYTDSRGRTPSEIIRQEQNR